MNKKQLYENLMKNVARNVMRSLNEQEKKTDAQKKAEAKLPQDEKVDLWMEGKRDINLEACGPDKLRKYYQICKAKSFASGVAQIERVAKSKNIKLEKEIKESFDQFEDEQLIDPVDFSKNATELFDELGYDGKLMNDLYDGAYEYFAQDFALYCKYQNPGLLKSFIKFKQNYID